MTTIVKDEAGIRFLTFSFDEKAESINILDTIRDIPGGLIKTLKYIWIKWKLLLLRQEERDHGEEWFISTFPWKPD